MPLLTPEEKEALGPLIEPFGRSSKIGERRELKDGEKEDADFLDHVHNGEHNGEPQNVVYVTQQEVDEHLKVSGRYNDKSYLWVIDDCRIKILREKTANTKSARGFVCHTNLTGARQAYIGGEMFFSADKKVYINHFSDRYGNPSSAQWEAAKAYIRKAGYNDLIDLLELMGQNGAGN